ncbi:MAG: YafY family transcriptional regulator [Oscillospiraceae bacterium]|nr:YafY family transcriptional regulator [Oscillospiraceae bacterium]
MKIDRLIGIITILLQKDKVTAPELAKRFEVSRRTINRDIEDINKAGIPIVTTQGSGGGISILDSYKMDKTLLNHDELQAIFSGLKGIDSISKTSYLTKMIEKLSGKNNRFQVDDSIIIDLSSHYQKPLTQKIDVIKNAIHTRQCISFRYYYQKGESVRCIEPYRLIFKWSSWYVFGYCLDRKAYRLFKLNRLWNISLLDKEFILREIPENELQLDDYFSSNTIHLKAIFSESEKYRLVEEYGINCYSVTDSGKLLLERDFASYDNMRSWIFSFGDKVTILEPGQLCEDRKKQAAAILAMKG